MARKVQRERSSTLDAALIEQLAKTIARMQNAVFTAKSPYEEPGADVYLLNNEQLREVPFGCHTFYVTDAMQQERLEAIAEAMAYGGLVVVYR